MWAMYTPYKLQLHLDSAWLQHLELHISSKRTPQQKCLATGLRSNEQVGCSSGIFPERESQVDDAVPENFLQQTEGVNHWMCFLKLSMNRKT